MAKEAKKSFQIYLTESDREFIEKMADITKDSKNGYVMSLIKKDKKRAERAK